MNIQTFSRGICAFLLAAALLIYQDQAMGGEATTAGTVVLDTFGPWRVHNTLSTPVAENGTGVQICLEGMPSWMDAPTESSPANWVEVEFNDRSWIRGTALRFCGTPYLARLCLRSGFEVTDPAKVSDLALSISYHGGVIVYLNGKEVDRNDVAAGVSGEAALAKPYPLEAFVDAAGNLLAAQYTYLAKGRAPNPTPDSISRMKQRERAKIFNISSSLLRKGINVLAVEIIRAPYNKVMLEKDGEGGKQRFNKCDWFTCQLNKIQLTAAGSAGLIPNATRPEEFQVWNSDPLTSDVDLDWGSRCDPLRSIQLAGARNGNYSGKVMVGSTKPIRELSATASDMKSKDDVIPASAIRISYGIEGGEELGTNRYGSHYPENPLLLGMVAEKAPAEITIRKPRTPQLAGAAVASVWMTVKIPKNSKPGIYAGMLKVQAKGEKPVDVSVKVKVIDWTLPDPQDYKTWVELIQVPDTLAIEYDLPLWSEKHFEMIGRSFRAISDSGSRVVYIPLIAHTNLGNAESMVRFVDKGNGKYDFDFSIMDKYLDIAEKNLGKPKIVCLQVWEIYMSSKESAGSRMASLGIGSGPQVTLIDPATKKTQNKTLPRLSDPSSKPVWRDLLTKVRERLRKRGLDKEVMLGMFTDATPTKEDAQFFHELAPDLPWIMEGHGLYEKSQKLHGLLELGYQATVWGSIFGDGVKTHGAVHSGRMFGWKRDILVVDFERNHTMEQHPPTKWRLLGEVNITGNQRGIGRIGADYWKAVKDKSGKRTAWVHDRFREGAWGCGGSMNLNLCNPVLGPGPDGPVATHRLIELIEGIQECEAFTLIERSITEPGLKKKLGADLSKRCLDALDERFICMYKGLSNLCLKGRSYWDWGAWRWDAGTAGHIWFAGSGWNRRSAKLYELAAEVAKKTSAK